MAFTPAAHTFIPLETQEQFDALLGDSVTRPVVIFKHSPACGTSGMAYDDLMDLFADANAPEIHLLNVLAHRSLSQAIATRLGVRHESPQVLVLKDGRAAWHGSHFRVTADALRKAVKDI
ncbi:MAG: bacillithiol system redox-active protein YtxJ [Vicinamibacterales bacterium]